MLILLVLLKKQSNILDYFNRLKFKIKLVKLMISTKNIFNKSKNHLKLVKDSNLTHYKVKKFFILT
jgi:hypothetical protein